MKLKEYFYLLGLKPYEKRYGYRLKEFHLDSFGPISYAQWKHPSEEEKIISEDKVQCLKTFLTEGDFCIDIGAHSGDTTIPMALAVGKSGLVLALEPNPFVFTVLNKNAYINKQYTNILPLMIAASETDGDMEFEYSDSGYCNGGMHENVSKWKHGHAFKLTVTGLNLTDVLRRKFSDQLPRLRYIKVDTEGYDLSVLNSCRDIIEEYRPFIKTEIYKHTDTLYKENMFTFFSDKGYSIFKVKNESDYRGEMLNQSDMSKWKHYDIFCVPNE